MMKRHLLLYGLICLLTGQSQVLAAVIPDASLLPREAGAPPLPQMSDLRQKHRLLPNSAASSGADSLPSATNSSASASRRGSSSVPQSKAGAEGGPSPGLEVTGARPVRPLQVSSQTRPGFLWLLILLVFALVGLAGSQLRRSKEHQGYDSA